MHLDLCGPWEVRYKKERWMSANVPGCIHTDLFQNGRIPDPYFGSNELSLEWIEHTDFEYRRDFVVSSALLSHSVIELIADGISYKKYLKPGDQPIAEFCVKAEKVSAREYCNLHGLWKGE